MTVKELIDSNLFTLINPGDNDSSEITLPFCCDLLSIAMSKAPAGGAWVTVMGNINTLAVATLCDVACIILAEGVSLDEAAAAKAKQQDVTVLATELPIFDAALAVYRFLNPDD